MTPVRLSYNEVALYLIAFIFFFVEKYCIKEFDFLKSKIFNFDYFFIFIFPPVLEILFRILYALSRSIPVNRSIFQENSPIENWSDDKTTRKLAIDLVAEELNNSYFKNSYSIGIAGNWGVGKTSFIRVLEEKIKKDSIVIHFNPWLSVGRNSLVHEFIESLKTELARYDTSIAKNLDRYLKSLVEIEKHTKTDFSSITATIFFPESSSRGELQKIRRAIKLTGKRIIVFVDDFDRLDKQEILDVLKLIRNTGDFPNTIYISCYDKLFILNALQNFNKRNLNTALDKFFDIEISLSPIPFVKLTDELMKGFFEYFEIESRYSDEIINVLQENAFSHFRDTKRFLSAIRLDYLLYGKTLFIKDFFFFELLKVRYPSVIDILWRERNNIFNKYGLPEILILSETDEERSELKIISILKEKKDDLFLTEDDIKLISTILSILFPREIGHPYAIQELNLFESYFYANIPDADIFEINWTSLIKNKAYADNSFFKDDYNIKKEKVIFDALIRIPNILEANFNPDNAQSLFDFLLFLILWSEGKLSIDFFKECYKRVGINKNNHFASLINSPTSSPKELLSRMNFLSQIARIYIEEHKDTLIVSSIRFIERRDVTEINGKLFENYLNLINEFTNEAFTAFYYQIETIYNREVVISDAAYESLLNYVSKESLEYLDLLVRSEMTPNSNLEFVFEPFTVPKMFGGAEKFIAFILNQKNYPQIRKDKLLAYLNKSFKSEYGALKFNLTETELSTMPIEFKNAWSNLPKELKNKISETTSEFKFDFSDQKTPTNKPDRNDHILPQVFEIRNGRLIIDINPLSSEFWRFGIKFSTDKNFPSIENPRHPSLGNINECDICLSVGSMNEEREWVYPNVVVIDHYNIQPITNYLKAFHSYQKEPITLTLNFDSNQQRDKLKVEFSGISVGTGGYEISKFKYFRLSAWCDERPFKLKTKITSIMDVKS